MRPERTYAARMLIRTPRAAATAAAAFLTASLGLGACSSGSNATVTHTPALQTVGGRDTARSTVQSSILIADTTNGIALPGGPTPAGLIRRVYAVVHGGRRIAAATGGSTGACSNGVKQSQTTNSTTGARTTTTDYYYEPTCATLEAEDVITVDTPATPGSTTGSGTITNYDTSGNIRVVQTLTLKVTTSTSATNPAETFTLNDSASATQGGTTTAAIGATCVGTPPSATMTCSVAHYGTSAGTVTGEAFATTATAGTSGGNATADVSVAFFAGTTLGVQASGVNWGVTGANAFNQATGTYGYTTSGPTGSGTLTLKDALYTYVSTATLSSTGLSVSIIENPNDAVKVVTPIATATLDVTGTGVLTYADGKTEPIAGGLIGF
jgi:hypothetical protein